MVTPAARREAVAHLRSAFEASERRACAALGVERTSVRYRGDRPDDTAVRARLRELAAIRRRFGYRRLLVLMRREGLVMNHKKFRRLYREERLQVRRRGGRKRALGTHLASVSGMVSGVGGDLSLAPVGGFGGRPGSGSVGSSSASHEALVAAFVDALDQIDWRIRGQDIVAVSNNFNRVRGHR